MQTKAALQQMLQNYKESVAALNMLKVELSSSQSITPEEVIEDLMFYKDTGERVRTSSIGDRTAKAAMIYPAVCDHLNSEARTGLADRFIAQQREIQLLETAVAGLPANERIVVSGFYFEQKAITLLAGELSVSARTVRKYREAALSHLVMIYDRYNHLT